MHGLPRIRLAPLLPPEGKFHVARVTLRAGEGQPHRHDFAELFWVQQGTVRHTLNGSDEKLSAGSLRPIRADDAHDLRPIGGSAVIVNVAFPVDTLKSLARRYRPSFPGTWPWSKRPVPPAFTLDHHANNRMNARAARLLTQFDRPHTALMLDRFLVPTLDDLAQGQPEPDDPKPTPLWLRDAMKRFEQDHDALAVGREALIRFAGRGGDHLNRVMQAGPGMTTTAWVQQARLREAARRLRVTDDPILAIGIEVGLPNVGHFYSSFRKQFGTTPRRYRLQHARGVIAAD